MTSIWQLLPGQVAALDDDLSLAQIEVRRVRGARALPRREQLVPIAIAVAYAVAAFALPIAVGDGGAGDVWVFVVLALLYGLLTTVEFEIALGSAIPTQLVFVPMLFVLPVSWAPLCVGVGALGRRLYDSTRGRTPLSRTPLALACSWYAFGPVVVLLALGGHDVPRWNAWAVYTIALLAQFGCDFATSSAWGLSLRLRRTTHFRQYLWTYAIDASLAPVGLLVAFAAHDAPYRVALVLPLVALLALFARERGQRIDAALELGHAYRGTAMLLGDVVEADDAYTGMHSRDVVSLTLQVADRFGLEGRARRDAEFTALLHDVGKIRMPSEIINKPGPLDPDERRVIETHTLEGEAMLTKVGGLLGQVGSLVRSCHERWDGTGYPDRLAGERIPLIARIVCCTDAFCAMTTDRPYRRARSVGAAVAELHRCSGTHFDPQVVDAVLDVVARS